MLEDFDEDISHAFEDEMEWITSCTRTIVTPDGSAHSSGINTLFPTFVETGTWRCFPLVEQSTPMHHWILRSLYVEELRRWRAVFSPQQIFVVVSEQLKVDPQSVLGPSAGGGGGLGAFAGLRPQMYPKMDAIELEAFLRNRWGDAHERDGWLSRSKHEPIEAALEARMRAFFAPYNARLQKLLDVDEKLAQGQVVIPWI
jgi:hypothetical protein